MSLQRSIYRRYLFLLISMVLFFLTGCATYEVPPRIIYRPIERDPYYAYKNSYTYHDSSNCYGRHNCRGSNFIKSHARDEKYDNSSEAYDSHDYCTARTVPDRPWNKSSISQKYGDRHTYKKSSPFRSLRYTFISPLKHTTITDPFGKRRVHPVNGSRGVMHRGVDLRARIGTPVYAISSGKVLARMWDRYYGLFIDLDHGKGIRSRYAHLSKSFVYTGQHVQKGELIGLTGNTGRTTGPHLHFELWINGKPVNPEKYIIFRK